MIVEATDTRTGEIVAIDISRLAYPPRRTKYNVPVRTRKVARRRMRRADRETLFVLSLLSLAAIVVSIML